MNWLANILRHDLFLDFLFPPQSLEQMMYSKEVADDLELLGPLLQSDQELLSLDLIVLFSVGYHVQVLLHILHPPKMLKISLKVEPRLTLLVLKSVTLQLQLILPALALTIDYKPVIGVHSIDGGVASGL